MSTWSRRTMLRTGAVSILSGAGLLACSPAGNNKAVSPSTTGTASAAQRRMPAESAPHVRTFMSWPSLGGVWAGADGPAVQADIAGIARAIGGFEPVVMLAAPEEVPAAQRACGSGIEVIPITVDDLWIRDSGPTFVRGPGGSGRIVGIDFHFNGWGGKQQHDRDALVADAVLARYDIPRIDAPITAEGGSLETDGAGTLMATESSLVNANRNPGKTREDIERALKDLIGVSRVIWFDGVRGQDITDYHVDSIARFTEPDVVLLSRPPDGDDIWTDAYRQAREVLRDATDARGRKFEIVDLPEPDPDELGARGAAFLGSYANYYVVNGGVIVPRFGDRSADDHAAAIIGEHHPGRTVVQVEISTIAEGGGGIHCATQQQPAA